MVWLYLCSACEDGDHARCEIGHPAPPGYFGGDKCRCPCGGNPDYNNPKLIDKEIRKIMESMLDLQEASKRVIKCNCKSEEHQCCDECTGWNDYVRKHGHPPKDKNVKAVRPKRPKKRKR